MNNMVLEWIKKNWFIICFASIIFLAGFLRFYRLNEVPVSLYWDEIATSYNAYAILHTGRDEYGNFLPLLFRSFDDYKMPGNIYLTTMPVAIFGLNEFSTRFTSAVAGTVDTFFIFYLVQELFSLYENEKQKKKNVLQKYSVFIALLVSFLFAISPWSIQFSRIEFEANVGTMFIIPAIMLFLRGIRKKHFFYFLLSSFLFALSIYFYRSIDLFIPLLLTAFFLIFYKELLHWKKTAVFFPLIFIILSLPMIIALLGKNGSTRANQVSVFNNAQDAVYTAAKNQQKNGSSLLSKIIYNRRLVYAEIITQGYLSHFSWDFLFTKGDPEGRHSTRGMGMMYLWEFPFLLLGLYILFWRMPKKAKLIILSWILLAPIPAAISVPTPHALRSLNILPMPELLVGLGITWLFLLLSKKWRIVFSVVLSLTVLGSLGYYLYLYYGPNIKITSSDFGDGYKQLFQYTIPREQQYQKIVITGHYWKPYIYALFYKKYNPLLYQKSGHWYGFDKYLFSGTRWGQGEHELDNVNLKAFAHENNILVALSPDEYVTQKDHVKILQKIYNHHGDLVFLVGKVL